MNVPGLEPLATVTVRLDPILDLGATQWGNRRVVPIVGGAFTGERFSGEVLPGGADWQVVHADGSITVDTRYTLRTHDGALVYLQTTGYRTGSPEVLARLGAGEAVDPAEYYFRLFCRFETGAARYTWLNTSVVVAAAARRATEVVYNAYLLT
ncbi:UPF0311 protein [Virgisporangium aliadipatigenens]|uniref:UPF0311 protein Val02_68210 n=1 Tax=Virgisporangium aliadipatigenens TaxID=741659 RepID=A0A8J3YU65_9ACTN|nr:DUF3237 domain-containing protein [Virgisporangium aliadipatigenens]GIJ49935.1 UPF0311 protein [Virgisporangium aliadipatigenens]